MSMHPIAVVVSTILMLLCFCVEPALAQDGRSSESSETYAVLILPIVILLIGIGAALAYHKVLK